MQRMMGFLITVFTANLHRNLTDKNVVNRLRFDRIVAISLWPFFGPTCISCIYLRPVVTHSRITCTRHKKTSCYRTGNEKPNRARCPTRMTLSVSTAGMHIAQVCPTKCPFPCRMLGPCTRVHTPNSISISSSVFAVLTNMSGTPK